MRTWLKALELTSGLGEAPTRTFPVVLDELASRYGDASALIAEDETLTFADLARCSRRYSRWAIDQALGKGDTVALVMPNRPEYIAAWAGLSRIGCIVALINTNLAGTALAHCIAAAKVKAIIVDARCCGAVRDALPLLDAAPRLFVRRPICAFPRSRSEPVEAQGRSSSSDSAAARPLSAGLSKPLCGLEPQAGSAHDEGSWDSMDLDTVDGSPLAQDVLPMVTLDDPALYIYTSGTTGLPKAARVSHRRIMTWSFWFAGLIGTTPEDRMYDCLPLYHSVGGVVAVGSVLVSGGSVVIAEKFSASRFWDDIRRHECTVFQYIGELCRYLAAAPPSPAETGHRLRLACGNGLRADVWTAFQQRFAVPRILEFYAATEGNFSLVNVEGEVGSIGRIPPFLAHRFPAAIVRFDQEREQPLRDAEGLCIRCARGEPGEAIGLISDGEAAHGGAFEGYTSAAETDRKVLRDVFRPGDRWFRTGDLMRLDGRGFYYFVDRIGDTFRWKGENVATSEVAEALTACPGVIEATVYGVAVPGADGRAGMAAIVAGPNFSLEALREHLRAALPAYARPPFLRLQAAIAMTETFKPKKADLVREGFDPARILDPLVFDDARRGAYVRLDAVLFAAILAGQVRL
jgi:fatty-acyl-CoA synthase